MTGLNLGTKPSFFRDGYKHSAVHQCPYCKGTGIVGSHDCTACYGAGDYEVGCGGSVEVDIEYFSAYCRSCGKFIPMNEVA